MKNNSRIKEIAKGIYPYTKIADVGTDHGYLLLEAFSTYSSIEKAIAIDNKEGPLNACMNNLKSLKNKNIRYSLSSGIKDIDDDTEVVIIAGMGGILISNILDDNIKNVKRFIIQANRDIDLVRKKVVSKGFYISKEEVVLEKGHYYVIISFDKSENIISYSEFEYRYGPLLLKSKDELFMEMIINRYNTLIKINNINDCLYAEEINDLNLIIKNKKM